MIFISHRGNIDRIILEEENNPKKILHSLSLGYDVEIDVWSINNKIYLGHDEGKYNVKLSFLKNKNLWCHAKNLQALEIMLQNNITCFWHEKDQHTLTSNGIIWTYPGYKLNKISIAVLPEKVSSSYEELKNCFGICSDNIEYYKKMFNMEK
jgi:hypothetical protein